MQAATSKIATQLPEALPLRRAPPARLLDAPDVSERELLARRDPVVLTICQAVTQKHFDGSVTMGVEDPPIELVLPISFVFVIPVEPVTKFEVLVQTVAGEEPVRVGRGCRYGVAAFGTPASIDGVHDVRSTLVGRTECVEDRGHRATGRKTVLHDGAGRELEVERDVAINVLQEAGCRT